MIIKGDINKDGKIDIVDWFLIRLNLLGLVTFTEEQKKAADTNNDGKISISDLANLNLHQLGLYIIDEVIE